MIISPGEVWVEIQWTAGPDVARRRRALGFLSRRRAAATAIVTGLLVGGGLVSTITSYGFSVVGNFFVGYWLAAGLFVGWAYRWRLSQVASSARPRSENVEVAYTVTASSWRGNSVYSAEEYSWRVYTGLVELDDQFLLMLSPKAAHTLPKAGLSPDELASLRALLAGLYWSTTPPLDVWQPPVEQGMRIEITTRFNQRLLAAAWRHVFGSLIARSIGVGVAYILLAALLIASGPRDLGFDVAAGWLVGWGVFRVVRVSTLAGRLARQVPAALHAASVLTVATSGLYDNGELGRAAMRWESFVDAHELPGQILLMLAKRSFLSIPTGDVSLEDLQTLRTFLANRDWQIALKAAQTEPAPPRPRPGS
jgi:hypothetical protein